MVWNIFLFSHWTAGAVKWFWVKSHIISEFTFPFCVHNCDETLLYVEITTLSHLNMKYYVLFERIFLTLHSNRSLQNRRILQSVMKFSVMKTVQMCIGFKAKPKEVTRNVHFVMFSTNLLIPPVLNVGDLFMIFLFSFFSGFNYLQTSTCMEWGSVHFPQIDWIYKYFSWTKKFNKYLKNNIEKCCWSCPHKRPEAIPLQEHLIK